MTGRLGFKKVMFGIGLAGAFFYFISLVAVPTNAAFLRGYHLLIITALVLISKAKDVTGYKRILYLLLVIPSIATYFYSANNLDELLFRGGLYATNVDLIMAFLGIIIVLFTTYLTIGPILPLFSLIFVAYGLFGSIIPGYLGHAGYSLNRILITLYGYDGINGMPTAVAASNLAMFIIFGKVLETTGVGDFLIAAAEALTRRMRGGAAKTAVVGSALFGTVSGSAVSNVVGTGTLTIPMMISMGYDKTFAGAVEAVASTGGQIMPPIMASGAFIMAEMLGVPYTTVAISAVLPAILYYVSCWVAIDLRTQKLGLTAHSTKGVTSSFDIKSKSNLLMLAPIVVLVYLLFVSKWTPIRSAFSAIIVSYVVMMFIQPGSLLTKTYKLIDALQKGVNSLARVAPACACAGTIGGIIGLTGLGTKIASTVTALSGGILYIALFLCMFVAIIFGMAMPTTISYLLASTILGTTLISLGLEPIAAHMFIFYFAVLSSITPPVALAAYAAAGISGSKPLETAVQSVKIALPTFIIAYVFATSPELLLIGKPFNIVMAFISTFLGVLFTCYAIEGWVNNGPICMLSRILLIVAAILLIDTSFTTDFYGLAFAIIAAIFEIRRRKRQKRKVNASI